jgi:hypothetical protein
MPGVLRGQAGSTILSRDLNRKDWGLQDWADIRMGQVSVVHHQEEDRLEINLLRRTAPPRLSFPVQSRTPTFTGNCYLVSEFESGNTNRLGCSGRE